MNEKLRKAVKEEKTRLVKHNNEKLRKAVKEEKTISVRFSVD